MTEVVTDIYAGGSIALGKSLVFGHRGASYYAPMNTLPAFELAADQGADGVELDVHLSSDDALVVIHDFDVDETTDGSGRVDAMTLEQLKALDAGSWFDVAFAQTRIPTLDEVFEAVGQRLFINVEIKAASDGIEQAVADCIKKRHSMERRVIISSFNPLILSRFRRVMPQVPVGYLYSPDIAPEIKQLMMGVKHEARHPMHTLIDKVYMTTAKGHGYRVNTWTVNDPTRAVELQRLGVDVIITDKPDVILAALEAANEA